MADVGIKRVFWTNSEGQWECSKVRELMSAIRDGTGEIFVTKFEVLKRMEHMVLGA
jgi:hypothetical protein